MAAFRPPRERIDRLAVMVEAALKQSAAVTLKKPAEGRAIFSNALAENLRIEHDIEQETLATLQKHGQAIYQQNADFQALLNQGKKVIAKKRGFVL
ncbi:DUF507 family protein [Candidatus Sumerlaeota bacterium]|nr:DUF507 family protein [Candidatus Sumerlaeota bacterium]